MGAAVGGRQARVGPPSQETSPHMPRPPPPAKAQLGDSFKDVFSRTALLFFVVAFLTFMRQARMGLGP